MSAYYAVPQYTLDLFPSTIQKLCRLSIVDGHVHDECSAVDKNKSELQNYYFMVIDTCGTSSGTGSNDMSGKYTDAVTLT
jgi:hypothetical protein